MAFGENRIMTSAASDLEGLVLNLEGFARVREDLTQAPPKLTNSENPYTQDSVRRGLQSSY
jgi:hypothetical protein